MANVAAHLIPQNFYFFGQEFRPEFALNGLSGWLVFPDTGRQSPTCAFVVVCGFEVEAIDAGYGIKFRNRRPAVALDLSALHRPTSQRPRRSKERGAALAGAQRAVCS
jgi:hypothetical protein